LVFSADRLVRTTLLGLKPGQLLIFKRPQLALKLQGLLQQATSAAAKHSNLSIVNQPIAAMHEHSARHYHVAGWAPVRRCLHPQAREFLHTATNNASSARIDRWLVSDSLVPDVSAASVTDLILSDHYGVANAVSPANAPPRGPGLWSRPPAIISRPEFKTLMTAQIQTFLQANPVTTTLSRAARWDKPKVDIQDVAKNYYSTFYAQRTRQLRVLRV